MFMKKFISLLLASTLMFSSTSALAMGKIYADFVPTEKASGFKNTRGEDPGFRPKSEAMDKLHAFIWLSYGVDCSGCWFNETMYIKTRAEFLDKDGNVLYAGSNEENIPIESGYYYRVGKNAVGAAFIEDLAYYKAHPEEGVSQERLDKVEKVTNVRITATLSGPNTATVNLDETFSVKPQKQAKPKPTKKVVTKSTKKK